MTDSVTQDWVLRHKRIDNLAQPSSLFDLHVNTLLYFVARTVRVVRARENITALVKSLRVLGRQEHSHVAIRITSTSSIHPASSLARSFPAASILAPAACIVSVETTFRELCGSKSFGEPVSRPLGAFDISRPSNGECSKGMIGIS